MSPISARVRAAWPLLLLMGGLACIVLSLLEAGRSVRTNRELADQALRGYGSFAAWSYAEHVSEAIRVATQEVLGSVNMFHERPPIPPASGPSHSLQWNNECYCHQPRFGPLPIAFIGFTLGTDTIDVEDNRAPAGSPGWLTDASDMPAGAVSRPPRSLSNADRRWMNRALTTLARRPVPRWGYHFLVATDGDSTTAFALTRMPTSWGDTVIYAVQYAKHSVDSLLASAFEERDLLPGALAVTGSNRELLDAEVRDSAGHVLFQTRPGISWSLDAVARLPPSYGGLVMRFQVQPQIADNLLIGGLPRSRLPLLLALLVLAVGLTAFAVLQLRREARFARDRSAFVASASHELRTPLAQIRLVVDMLRLNREPDPVRRESALALVDREVTRLQNLVDTVLRFTRGAVGPGMEREPVDVVAEVRSVVAEFAPLAEPRGVQICVRASTAPVVQLQGGAVRQVLLNLLDNAVKYGPDGQSILVEVEPIGGRGARIVVTDAGPGVPIAERARIWRPFERGAAASQRAAGGSGIGLTVVREIAERHGGTARVEPHGGPGAKFVVEFPGESE